jgi:hypothetical protein
MVKERGGGTSSTVLRTTVLTVEVGKFGREAKGRNAHSCTGLRMAKSGNKNTVTKFSDIQKDKRLAKRRDKRSLFLYGKLKLF